MQEKNTRVDKILDQIKKHYGLRRDGELANFLGVKSGTLSAWKSRGSIGAPEKIIDKCQGMNLAWLRTGEGPMFNAVAEDPGKYEVTREIRGLDQHEEKLLELLREFPEALETVEGLVKLPRSKRMKHLSAVLEDLEEIEEEEIKGRGHSG